MQRPDMPAPIPPDHALIARAQAGNADAIERLLAQYQGPLLRFSLGMCKNPADAEDVVQESLIAAARGMGQFRGDSSITSWLYAIARSFCIKQRRGLAAAARSTALPLDAPALSIADSAPSPDETAAHKELRAALDAALHRLSPDHREVLLLRDVEGLTAPEVADALELNVPQVKSRLHRARAALRSELTPVLHQLQGMVPDTGCPDIAETFSQYLEDEISPDLCSRMQDHVASCPHCSNTCDNLKRTLAVCHAVPAPTVPLAIQDAIRNEIRKLHPGLQP